MSNYIEENKIFSERLGNKYWICDLRRSNDNNENRINLIRENFLFKSKIK